MDSRYALIAALGTFACIGTVFSLVCKEEWYWDSVMKKCFPCSDICHLALNKITQETCKNRCPVYLSRYGTGLPGGENEQPTYTTWIYITVGLILLLIVLVSLFAIIYFCRKRCTNTNTDLILPIQRLSLLDPTSQVDQAMQDHQPDGNVHEDQA